jgi:aminoglycoside phosphotransferase (APT) family kinase protein
MYSDLIQEAIDHFDLDVKEIAAVEESYSSIVRILTLEHGEHLVLKIPFIQHKLFRELTALQHLQYDLPVPVVLDYWVREDDNPGALLLSYLPGKVITGRVTPDLAFGMGALLANLHTHQLDDYGEVFEMQHDPHAGWWAMMDRYFNSWKILCVDILPPDLFEKTLERYAQLSKALPEPESPSWVHFDYRPGNILAQGEIITGLIDFESSRAGSSDLDFVKIKDEVWDVWPDTKAPFLRGYAAIKPLPDFESTLPFYELSSALGGIAWCVKRSKTDDPFFFINLQKIKQLLE